MTASMKASNARSEVVCGGCAWTTADWVVLHMRSVSIAVILSSCSAASNSDLEQTEWAQRCLEDTSRAGFGLTLPDRGDRVSSATTRAAMGETLRGAAGFRDQSRFAAVAFASGQREGASMDCDQWLPVLYDRFVAGGRMRMLY